MGSQAFHPLRHTGDGVDHAPADHQEGGQRDEERADQQADEIILPDEGDAVFDMFGLVENHQGSGHVFLAVQGEGVQVQLSSPHEEKAPLFLVGAHDPPDQGQRGFQVRRQANGGGHELVLSVVHRHSLQPFPVPEFLDDRLEALDQAFGDQGFNTIFQTLPQDGRPALQIQGHPLLFLLDLQDREENDDDADHDENRKDDAKGNPHRGLLFLSWTWKPSFLFAE